MTLIRIGILIYSGVQALDVTGPMDAFLAARVGTTSGDRPGYEVFTFSLDEPVIDCESGLRIVPTYTAEAVPLMDTLIIPGGAAIRDPIIGPKLGAWIGKNISRVRRIAAVCTGAFALAETGALDGRKVTTHWNYARQLAARYPKVSVQSDAIFLKDGPFYTSGGVTAGIDLALALVEEDYGPSAALAAARELVVYVKRPGGQAQFSEPLRLQVRTPDRLADVASYIATNLAADLSAEALAGRAHLSVRHFARRFRQGFGTAPATFVETARLEEARRLLLSEQLTIEQIAAAVGFARAHAFRRAFQRNFGVAPQVFRAGFGPQGKLDDDIADAQPDGAGAVVSSGKQSKADKQVHVRDRKPAE